MRPKSTSFTPLRIVTCVFAAFLMTGMYFLYSVTLKLQARLDVSLPNPGSGSAATNAAAAASSAPPVLRALSACPVCATCPAASTCAACPAAAACPACAACPAAAACPACPACAACPAAAAAAGTASAASAGALRTGLGRLLTDPELDELFRIRSELDSQALGSADAELLLPFMRAIHGEHCRVKGRGPAQTGGFVDVGSNIGDVSESVLATFSDHARRFYYHHLAPPNDPRPPLVDAVHPLYEGDKVAFVYALEPSAATRVLLERRAEAGLWARSNFRLFPVAITNASGTARFCSHNSGSGQSSLAGSEQGGIVPRDEEAASAPGERSCTDIDTLTLADLLDVEGDLTRGLNARVFLLKVDVEGAEAVVLAGAAPLFAAKRISYVVFENHMKWADTQAALGLKKLISVGEVVTQLARHGYKCHYVSPWGLLPFEIEGTETGDAPRPGCNEGLPFCARHRLYNRQFWVRWGPHAHARAPRPFPLHHASLPAPTPHTTRNALAHCRAMFCVQQALRRMPAWSGWPMPLSTPLRAGRRCCAARQTRTCAASSCEILVQKRPACTVMPIVEKGTQGWRWLGKGSKTYCSLRISYHSLY